MDLDSVPLETAPEAVLDLQGFEDERWAKALDDGDEAAARDAFVAALRDGPTRTSPETDIVGLHQRWYGSDPGHRQSTDPNRTVEQYHRGVFGVGHQFEGDIDWFYNATAESDDNDFSREWQWQLNRHYQWIGLATAYEESSDPEYAEAFENQLLSWLEACPRPDDSGNYYPSAWRTIEAGIRAGWIWPYAFETFRRSEAVSDRALWLWVCSFRDHGLHLLRYPMSGNWKTMESNGLAHAGAMFPELDGAAAFRSTGVDRSVAELERQFYEDGLQTELAPGYASVSITNTYAALQVADRGQGVPRRSLARLETIGEGYGRLAAPDGVCPALHDSKTLDARPIYEEFVADDDPLWRSGTSDRLPWGGYGILRNEGRYALLDAGPYGTSHQHQDTLQVLGFADDEWLLVDPGVPQYTDAPETHHIRSAAGHNLVLLDRQRHRVRPEVLETDEPLPLAVEEDGPLAATAAERTFETDDGATFDHERLLCDVADVGWVVVDRLAPRDEEPHEFEWIWQSPGEWSTNAAGGIAEVDGGPTLRVEPAGTREWTATARSAAEDPLRGWQTVGDSYEITSLPTLCVESEPAAGPAEMVTLLSPVDASLRDVSFEAGTTVVRFSNGGDGGTLVVKDGEEVRGIDTVSYDGPAGERTLTLEEHAFLADD